MADEFMHVHTLVTYDDPQILRFLDKADSDQVDALEFGVIGFDVESTVRVYNAWESRCASLPRVRVIGHPMFTHVAQCMNNYLVAHRFEQALANREALDATIDYVLTLRMRPTKVKLRLLADPAVAMRYILVERVDA